MDQIRKDDGRIRRGIGERSAYAITTRRGSQSCIYTGARMAEDRRRGSGGCHRQGLFSALLLTAGGDRRWVGWGLLCGGKVVVLESPR
jgi:hypothetical protein